MFYSLLILLELTACWNILDWRRTVSDRTAAHFLIAESEPETEQDGEEKENLRCVLYQALKEFHTADLAALRALVSQSTKSFKSALSNRIILVEFGILPTRWWLGAYSRSLDYQRAT